MTSRVLATAVVVLVGVVTLGCSTDDEAPAEPFVDGDAVAVPIDDVEEPLRIRSQGTLARLNEDVSTWLFLEDHVDWNDLNAEDLASLQDELNAAIDAARPDDLFELSRLSVYAEGTAGYCLTRDLERGLLLVETTRSADGGGMTSSQVGTEKKPLAVEDVRDDAYDLDVCTQPGS